MSAFLRGVELQQGVHRLDRRRQPAPAVSLPEAEPPRAAARPLDAQAQLQAHLQAQAQQLEQARAQLEQEQRSWRAQADEELVALREKTLKEAQATGQAQGLAQAREAHQQKLQQLDATIGRLAALLGDELESSQDLVVAIAYASVIRVLGEAVATPEGVRAVVVQAIAAARQQEKLVVRVPAADYRLLIDELPGDDPLARPGIEIRPDAQITDGGCLIETDSGQLDARLATQLAALRTVLLQARKQGPARGA